MATIFSGTPFIIAGAIGDYGISRGSAALLSTLQVGAFMLANLTAGRRMHPSVRLVRLSLAALTAINLVSAVAPTFTILATSRFAAGLPMGLITWLSWSTSASDGRRRGEVAAMGPLAAAAATPIVGLASSFTGLQGIYLLMAAVTALCLLVPIQVDSKTERPRGHRNPIGAPIVKVVLFSLFLSTGAGSAVFVFVRVIADDQLGLSTFATSIALSINALAGIPTARFPGRRRVPGLWLVVIGACALAVSQVQSAVVFYVSLALWGLAFWSFVPEAFSLLAERSVFPGDRVGDAQAVMSFGRVLGPTLGGVLLTIGGFGLLGWTAAVLLVVAALAIEFVSTEHRRSSKPAQKLTA